MTNNKTPLQEALSDFRTNMQKCNGDSAVTVYKAARAYADLPEKIEGMIANTPAMNNTEDDYNAGRVHAFQDILNLLKEGV